MKLHEVVKARKQYEDMLANERSTFVKLEKDLLEKIENFKRLEVIGSENIDIEKVQIAEKILEVEGDPYGMTNDCKKTIAESAIEDIANGCEYLQKRYFGNKRYDRFYQREDHEYGYAPKHGHIVDSIGFRRDLLSKELTGDQKDACIYYLKNYQKIKEVVKHENS